MTSGNIEDIKAELQRSGFIRFAVVTASMEPLIRAGDEIRVTRLSRPPRRFDIVVYWDGSRCVCHYVWHVNSIPEEDGSRIYVTRNLLNGTEDLPISEKNLVGLVESHALGAGTRFWIHAKTILAKWKRGILSG